MVVDWGDDERRLTSSVSVLGGPSNGAYPSGNTLLVRGSGETRADRSLGDRGRTRRRAGAGRRRHQQPQPRGPHGGQRHVRRRPVAHPHRRPPRRAEHRRPARRVRPRGPDPRRLHVDAVRGVQLRAPARRRGLPRRPRLRPRRRDDRGGAPARPHPRAQRVPDLERRVLPVRHRPHRLRPVLRRRVERSRRLRGEPAAGARRGGRLLRHVPPQGRDRGSRGVRRDGRRVRRRHRSPARGDARLPRRAAHDRRHDAPPLHLPPPRRPRLRRCGRAPHRVLARATDAGAWRGRPRSRPTRISGSEHGRSATAPVDRSPTARWRTARRR